MKIGVDYIGVGVGAFIINKEGKIFLSKRGKACQNEVGKWEMPGGVLEFGENPKDTIIREIKEEFGFEVEPVEEFTPFNHIIPEEKQHWIALKYICMYKNGKPKILEPNKSEQIGWFSMQEMSSMLLTLPASYSLLEMKRKYPKGLPKL